MGFHGQTTVETTHSADLEEASLTYEPSAVGRCFLIGCCYILIFPHRVRLVNGAPRRKLVSTTMGCAWKYERSFFIATRRNAACSRWLYCVVASVKDLLTKNTGLCFFIFIFLEQGSTY